MIDDVFAVIADPTRRQILRVLAGGETPVGALVEELGVSQPTVSKHLKVLRTAGLVTTRAQGQKRLYSLTPEPLSKVTLWIDTLNKMAGRAASSAAGRAEVATSAASSTGSASEESAHQIQSLPLVADQAKAPSETTRGVHPASEANTHEPPVESQSSAVETRAPQPKPRKTEDKPQSFTPETVVSAAESAGENGTVLWQTAPVAENLPSLLKSASPQSDEDTVLAANPETADHFVTGENTNSLVSSVSAQTLETAGKSELLAAVVASAPGAVSESDGPAQESETGETKKKASASEFRAAAKTGQEVSGGAVHFTPLTPFIPVPVAESGVRVMVPASNRDEAPADKAASIAMLDDIAVSDFVEESLTPTAAVQAEEHDGAKVRLSENADMEHDASDFIHDEPLVEEEPLSAPELNADYQLVEQHEESRGLLGAFSRLRRRRSR